MGSCIDECILLDVQSCICPWWSTHYRRHKHHHCAYAYLKCAHARNHNKFYSTSCPKKTSPQLIPAWAPAIIRPSPGSLPCLSLNLLLLNPDQLATTPPPERFPERSANSDERRKLPMRHYCKNAELQRRRLQPPADPKVNRWLTSLSRSRLPRERLRIARSTQQRREGGYEILTQRAISSRSDLGCLTCAAV